MLFYDADITESAASFFETLFTYPKNLPKTFAAYQLLIIGQMMPLGI